MQSIMIQSESNQGHLKAGIFFSILTFFLPIGLYFTHEGTSNYSTESLWVMLDFVFPVILEFRNETWHILFPLALSGIFFPFLLSAHLYLIYLGYKITKGQANQLHIYGLLLLTTLISSIVHFPTFGPRVVQFPLPLALLVGVPLARLAKLEYPDEPFKEYDK